MPTTYTDQFFVMDPGNRPPAGTNLTPQFFDFTDVDDNGFIEPGDLFGTDAVTAVWENDTITVTMGGSTVTITGTTFYITGQPAIFTPTDGTILEDAVFITSTFVTTATQLDVGELGPPCFTPGTMIETDLGPQTIETLSVGDLVRTRDHGLQPILWIGSRSVPAVGRFAPVQIEAGAIGNTRALRVSPQHRMLIEGWQAELFFGEESVLVPAKHLINGETIRQVPGGRVTYLHLLFTQHEIIYSDGVPSESFFVAGAMDQAGCDTRAELTDLFPDLVTGATEVAVARPVARYFEGMLVGV